MAEGLEEQIVSKNGISVFFSYGHDCEELVLRIRNDLTALGFEIWFDHHEIKEGNEWREEITKGILESDSVMAFLSRHSLRKNGVCLNELSIAVGCKYGHIKTVLLEPDIESLIPPTISGIQFCDMSKWRILKATDPQQFEQWYQEKLQSIIQVLSSQEAVEMNSQLKYLEQMLSPAMWQPRQQAVLKKQYIPRTELENELTTWIQEATASNVFLLYGEPGSGKSSFMINYHHFNHEAAAIAFCDWKRKSRDRISEIIRSIAFQLSTKIPAYRTALVWHLENKGVGIQQIDDASLFEMLLVNPMHGLIHSSKEVYLILIDSLNELNENGINPLAEIIAEQAQSLPKAIRFVVSTRMGDVVSRYFPECRSYAFLSDSECSDMMIRQFYALKLRERLELYQETVADGILDTLARHSEGNFLFAELCAKAINEGKMPLEDMRAIPKDLNGIYYRWFTTLFPDLERYQEQYYILLSVLCAVEDPIPQELLRGVMGWNLVAFNRFIKPLKDFLKIQKNAIGKPTVTLFHSSLKIWLTSEYAGDYMVDAEDGLTVMKEQLLLHFEKQTISAYQCKILISVLEKSGDDEMRRRVYGSAFFFRQYYALARIYETTKNGYHKAILIYTHLKEICMGLPTAENTAFLETIYPVAMSRCYCQIGDYPSAKQLLEENLVHLENSLESQDLMEVYYILGSVYDWLGNRSASVDVFTKLYALAEKENNPVYMLRGIIGLIWNEHFTNIDDAIRNIEQLSLNSQLSAIEVQMVELVRARIFLSVGKLDAALEIYDSCLETFDFSFQNDVRGYRKNRLMLLEILPACYDVNNYEKGVRTGELILKKIKNTGWLEECYCASWIALNYLGMGDAVNAERYLQKAQWHLGSVAENEKSQWLDMHLTSIDSFLQEEKGAYEEALFAHMKVAQKAQACNDPWVEGDACFEIAKLSLLYGLQSPQETAVYMERLTALAETSNLAHLIQKDVLIRSLFLVSTGKILDKSLMGALDDIDNTHALASTNYIDVFCIKAMIYKALGNLDKMKNAVSRIRELILSPEHKNRSASKKIVTVLRKDAMNGLDFNVEYCDPFENTLNYWMRLEHLGRYLWACDTCKQIERSTVADIACANGYGTAMLSAVSEQVWGFDRSGDYIALAPKKDVIEYVCCDFDKLPLDVYKEMFDLVVSFETIEHVKSPKHLIQLIANSLKPGGQLLLSFPNPAYEKLDEYGLNKDQYHLHILDYNTVAELLESGGLKVLEVLGQSYCNIKCNEENEAVKAGEISAAKLEQERMKDKQELLADARRYAIPNDVEVNQSYSFILRCKKE